MEHDVMEDAVDMTEGAVEVIDLPPVESSTGWKTVLGAGTAAVGLIFGGVKISQKVYDKHCVKQGIAPLEREKFYQFWRRKSKMMEPKVVPMSQRASIHDEESDPEED